MSSGTGSPKHVSSTSNAELRKIKKPLIERRRRERINQCLNELKILVLEAMNKDESCYSKMEKADILEMTVSHLKNLQFHRLQSNQTLMLQVEDASTRYAVGFGECAKQVGNYLNQVDDVQIDEKLQKSLMKHLEGSLQKPFPSVQGSSLKTFPTNFTVGQTLSSFQFQDMSPNSFVDIPSKSHSPAFLNKDLKHHPFDTERTSNFSRSSFDSCSPPSDRSNGRFEFFSPISGDKFPVTIFSKYPSDMDSKGEHSIILTKAWRPW